MSEPANFDSVAYNAQESILGNISPEYSQAINDSRFVKGFGLTALVYALISLLGLTLLSGGIGIGVGLFIARYDSTKYYRILGIVVVVFALLSYFIPFLGSAVLSCAVLGKGIQVLGVFSKVENKDEEWQVGRKRTLIGTVASGAGLGISVILMVLFLIASVIMLLIK
jgi:hypothetical protein